MINRVIPLRSKMTHGSFSREGHFSALYRRHILLYGRWITVKKNIDQIKNHSFAFFILDNRCKKKTISLFHDSALRCDLYTPIHNYFCNYSCYLPISFPNECPSKRYMYTMYIFYISVINIFGEP